MKTEFVKRLYIENLKTGEISKIDDEISLILQEATKYPKGYFGLIFRDRENQEPEVLLVKRKDFDIWNLPGGGGGESEDAFEAVAREVFEETGLVVKPLYTNIYAIDPPRNKQSPIGAENRADAFLGIVCRIDDGQLRLGTESGAIQWFPVNRLPENTYERHALLIQAFVSDNKSIEEIHSISKEHKFIPTDIFEE